MNNLYYDTYDWLYLQYFNPEYDIKTKSPNRIPNYLIMLNHEDFRYIWEEEL